MKIEEADASGAAYWDSRVKAEALERKAARMEKVVIATTPDEVRLMLTGMIHNNKRVFTARTTQIGDMVDWFTSTL